MVACLGSSESWGSGTLVRREFSSGWGNRLSLRSALAAPFLHEQQIKKGCPMKRTKKLRISRETVRLLDQSQDLKKVAAGNDPNVLKCTGCDSGCGIFPEDAAPLN